MIILSYGIIANSYTPLLSAQKCTTHQLFINFRAIAKKNSSGK